MLILLLRGRGASSLAPYRWWNDVLALLLFVVAALTVESGLLVGVIVIGAALVGGARRIARRARAGRGVAAPATSYLRFAVLDVGSPGLIERARATASASSSRRELVERFGANPMWFYVYNVVTSALSVVLAEPRAAYSGLTSAIAPPRLRRVACS